MAELSPEQKSVVDCWGKGLAVMAGAGSGKTTTLVTKCEELLKRWPEARFAAVSFTERSAGDLREKLALRLGSLERHWVMTIHGLCGSILREFPREAGFDGEESMLAESESQLLWEEAIDTLWFEDLPEQVRVALDLLLARESRDALAGLLARTRDLHLFGIEASLGASPDAVARALAAVHSFLMERYGRLKRRRGALDFNDLEAGADRALEAEHVRTQYQRRFDLVLIDEFQDTNPVQARILWRFVRPDASNLCVVGDPKQSIYRFRDADVSVFEEFCERLPERRLLTWNFRSRPGIIEYSNAVCAPAFEAAGMRYDALVPKRDEGAESPVVRVDVSSPADFARYIRAERDRGIALDEMALLLRRIRGNERWLKALVAEGIPIAVGSGGLFWEDPRAREILSFLKWWITPTKVYSGAVFLRAPWVAVPDRTLDEWVRRDNTFVLPFFESDHVLARALRPLRSKPARPGEVLLALLATSEIEEEIGAPLLGLWNRAEELSYRGLDFHEVIAELSKAMAEGRRERDVPPPRNLGQLAVLTLHSSKGLEFPHVILLDFAPRARNGDTPLLFWDRERGAFLGGRDSDGERMHRKDPVEKSWAEMERLKNLAESMRLFYVALTRARERLVMVCPEIASEVLEEKPYEADRVFLKDDWRGWIECAGARQVTRVPAPRERVNVPNLAREQVQGPVRPERLPAVPSSSRFKRPRHSVSEWALLSRCPRAYEWTFIRPRPIPDASFSAAKEVFSIRTSDEENGLTQRELGTRVHACLEHGDFEGLRKLEEEAGEDRFSSRELIAWAEQARCMRAPAQSELAFEASVAGEVLVGSMDRLVSVNSTDADDALIVVDFKVTAREKSRESLLEAYETQMLLYGEAALLLDPALRQEQVRLRLVHITPGGVQEIEVPFTRRVAESLATRASGIVNGAPGEPVPGPLCRFCDFGRVCPESKPES